MKQYVLQQARKSADVCLKDVAYLAGIDSANLCRIERQISLLPLSIALLYHRLFGVPLIELCSREYNHISKEISRKAQQLIDQLNDDPSPKSRLRIQQVQQYVQSKSTSAYDN